MGVLYLMDSLKNQDIESEMVGSNITTEDLESVLRNYQPDIVGMSVMTAPQIEDFEKHSIFIKDNFPDTKIVWGGSHPTLLSDLCMESEYIDHVFIGQGESVFPKMVIDLVEKKRTLPKEIRGHGPPNLDDFKPAWDKVDISRYLFSERHSVRSPDTRVESSISQSAAQIKKILGETKGRENDLSLSLSADKRHEVKDIEKWDVGLYHTDKSLFYYLLTSRGCPYKCTFCSEPLQVMNGDGKGKFLWNGHSVDWFKHQIESIKEILQQKGEQLDGVGIWDDMFWVEYRKDPRAFEVLDYLKDQNLGYLIEARADQLLRDEGFLIKKLADTGCIQVFAGAESITQETLNYIRKGTKATDYLTLMKYANEYQVAVRMSFIVGFPGEPDSSVNATLDFCESVEAGEYGPWVNISGPKIFTPYPGTVEYERAVEAGFRPPKTQVEWGHINRSTEEYLRHFPWMEQNYSGKTLKRLEHHFGKGYKDLVAH